MTEDKGSGRRPIQMGDGPDGLATASGACQEGWHCHFQASTHLDRWQGGSGGETLPHLGVPPASSGVVSGSLRSGS